MRALPNGRFPLHRPLHQPLHRLAGLAALGLLAGSVGAQAETTVTRSQSAAPGKLVRLLVAPNLKKDCSNGPMPEIKIATAPKNGSVVTRSGKLKTPASYRCPGKEAQALAVFYQSKAGYAGADEVLLEIKTSEGTLERQDIRITVDASAKEEPKDKDKDKDKGSDATDL